MLHVLDYPFEVATILRKKKALRRALLEQDKAFVKKNVTVLGGSTTSEIVDIMELFLLNVGVQPSFYQSEYNFYQEDALFGNEELDAFGPDIIYIHTTNVNILKYPAVGATNDDVEALLEEEHGRFRSIWSALNRYDCDLIQNNFDLPNMRIMGNLDCTINSGRTRYINLLNSRFSQSAQDTGNLYINDIHYLSSYVGLRNWYDRNLWYTAKYALSYEAIPCLAHSLSRIIGALFGLSKKCLTLDLDNTCWGGVIGDEDIELGPGSPLGEAYSDFQSYAKVLSQRGVALAVCSKNDQENAEKGFHHPDSVLSLEDFSSFKANWESKDENVVGVSEEINIGTDSIVFVDDNPVERDLVSAQVPGVEVPNVGKDVAYFIDYIDKSGYFEPVALSVDDMKRKQYLSANRAREADRSLFSSYEEFLASLKMKAEINKFNNLYLERITQLINKTNQFNLTTERYTSQEVEGMLNSDEHITLYGRLSDKHGDNGLIAVVAGAIDGVQCNIDLFLMSCRVLKRGMEQAMLDALVFECQRNGVEEIVGQYIRTKKNGMVSELYSELGFKMLNGDENESKWLLRLDGYQWLNTHIEIEHD